jgi:DUF1707 SHOCT-like domain/FHA domain
LSAAHGGADNPAVVADRASDADRERALAELSEGFVAGRLTHETFTHRVERALHAHANAELRGLVADLLPWRRRLAAAAGRRVLRSADRWLRGWPQSLPLPTGSQHRFTIGRELACDMTLTDLTVSRWHASLERGPDGWRWPTWAPPTDPG